MKAVPKCALLQCCQLFPTLAMNGTICIKSTRGLQSLSPIHQMSSLTLETTLNQDQALVGSSLSTYWCWPQSTMYYGPSAPLASSPDTRRQTVGRPKSVITHNSDPSCFTSLMSNPVIRLTTCTIRFVRTLPFTFSILPLMKELAPDSSGDL